jgi:hypothetical protein
VKLEAGDDWFTYCRPLDAVFTTVEVTAVNVPAEAVNWKARALEESGSVTVTVQRCFSPGLKEFPDGSARSARPPAGFNVTVWQEAQGVPVFGSPELPLGTREPLGYANKEAESRNSVSLVIGNEVPLIGIVTDVDGGHPLAVAHSTWLKGAAL